MNTDAELFRRHYYAILEAREAIDTNHPTWAHGWLEIAADWRRMLVQRRLMDKEIPEWRQAA